MKLYQRTILITGGNSGIGLRLAKQLHAKDNMLIIVSRSQNNWDELSKLNPKPLLLQYDLSRKEQVLQLAQQISEMEIKLDVLINCAAVQYTPKLIDSSFSFKTIQNEIAVNLIAPIELTQLFLPTLVSRSESAVVNLSSGLAFYPKSSSAVYCATKAALHNFSQSLRYQLTETPINVVEVILPLVDTPMTAGRGKKKISPEQAAREIIHGIENKREEIFVGIARFMPLLLRLWPSLLKRILSKH